MENLCGTGIEDHEAFIASAEQYGRKEFIKASLEFKSKEKPWLTASSNQQSFAERSKEILPLLALLLCEIGILVMASLWKFERYEVC